MYTTVEPGLFPYIPVGAPTNIVKQPRPPGVFGVSNVGPTSAGSELEPLGVERTDSADQVEKY